MFSETCFLLDCDRTPLGWNTCRLSIAPNAANQLANQTKFGPCTSLPAMAAVRFLFKNADICTISANHAFQASPQSHYERIAFIQHGLFRIVPSTRHHPVTRKSCAVRPSVAASHRYARPNPRKSRSCTRFVSSTSSSHFNFFDQEILHTLVQLLQSIMKPHDQRCSS